MHCSTSQLTAIRNDAAVCILDSMHTNDIAFLGLHSVTRLANWHSLSTSFSRLARAWQVLGIIISVFAGTAEQYRVWDVYLSYVVCWLAHPHMTSGRDLCILVFGDICSWNYPNESNSSTRRELYSLWKIDSNQLFPALPISIFQRSCRQTESQTVMTALHLHTDDNAVDKTDKIAFMAYKDKSAHWSRNWQKQTLHIAVLTKMWPSEVTERISKWTTVSHQQSSQYCTPLLATRLTAVCCCVHFPAASCCSAVLVVSH